MNPNKESNVSKRKNVRLKEMSEQEFQNWKLASENNYALDKEKEGYSKGDAIALSKKSFESLLPDGKDTKNHFIYRVIDADTSMTVGILWWGIQKQGSKDLPWIYDIAIEEKFQGQGYGKATMMAAEVDVKKHGHRQLGLHVFGHNNKARMLYESLNFKTTNVVMRKDFD